MTTQTLNVQTISDDELQAANGGFLDFLKPAELITDVIGNRDININQDFHFHEPINFSIFHFS